MQKMCRSCQTRATVLVTKALVQCDHRQSGPAAVPTHDHPHPLSPSPWPPKSPLLLSSLALLLCPPPLGHAHPLASGPCHRPTPRAASPPPRAVPWPQPPSRQLPAQRPRYPHFHRYVSAAHKEWEDNRCWLTSVCSSRKPTAFTASAEVDPDSHAVCIMLLRDNATLPHLTLSPGPAVPPSRCPCAPPSSAVTASGCPLAAAADDEKSWISCAAAAAATALCAARAQVGP